MSMYESMPSIAPDKGSLKRIHVAVGVIVNAEREVLISLRPKHVHQGGLWEFPGGKVESEETVVEALARELCEELGLQILSCRPMMEIRHDYSDRLVLLDVMWVDSFDGDPMGKEGQLIRWVSGDDLGQYEFPVANQAIVASLQAQLCSESM